MAFARKGIQTTSFDINPVAVALVNSGQMPFDEPQAPEILSEILAAGTFRASTDPAVVTDSDRLVAT
jgi:UDP-N-acetyl-D-mannosaminuronate dehydrogenase